MITLLSVPLATLHMFCQHGDSNDVRYTTIWTWLGLQHGSSLISQGTQYYMISPSIQWNSCHAYPSLSCLLSSFFGQWTFGLCSLSSQAFSWKKLYGRSCLVTCFLICFCLAHDKVNFINNRLLKNDSNLKQQLPPSQIFIGTVFCSGKRNKPI